MTTEEKTWGGCSERGIDNEPTSEGKKNARWFEILSGK